MHYVLGLILLLKGNVTSLIIVCAFELFWASHVIKNWNEPSFKIRFSYRRDTFSDSPDKKYWKFEVHICSNFDTGIPSIFGHVTCPAKCEDYYSHRYKLPYYRLKLATFLLRPLICLYIHLYMPIKLKYRFNSYIWYSVILQGTSEAAT